MTTSWQGRPRDDRGRWIPSGSAAPKPTPPKDDALLVALEQLIKISEGNSTANKKAANIAAVKSDLISLAIIWVLIVSASLYMGVVTAFAAIAESPAGKFFGLTAGNESIAAAEGGYIQDDRPLKTGDALDGGWKVTSDRGPRSAPKAGASTNHGGADLSKGIGTEGHPLVMPWNGQVECFSQRNGTQLTGAGHGARLNDGPDGLQLRTYHLQSACKSGRYKAGEIYGNVGNTGTSTGSHLHLERWLNGQQQDPTWGDALSVLGLRTQSTGDDFVEQYRKAIAQKESGTNYSAVNPHSGALGKYQFMPATMASTARTCLGRVPMTTEFLGTPELQDKIMDCYTVAALPLIQAKAADPNTQCRMLASRHYSGNPDKWNNNRPQTYGGASYPSIASYTEDVCKGF